LRRCSRRLRPGLRCGLRALRWWGIGNGGRWWCRGADGRTGNWRSALPAKSLTIVQRTATIPAKTSHYCLRREAWLRCVMRFLASCQNHQAWARVTCGYAMLRSWCAEGRMVER
jgi:hypothetical protein